MQIRKLYRMSPKTINSLILDFTSNRIYDKKQCLIECVHERIDKLNSEYERYINMYLDFIILKCQFNDLPITAISKMIASISKVTTAISKGILYIIDK